MGMLQNYHHVRTWGKDVLFYFFRIAAPTGISNYMDVPVGLCLEILSVPISQYYFWEKKQENNEWTD